MPLKLKDEHKGTVVGFGKSAKPLGERSEADLLKLYQMSKRNSKILDYFSETPTDDEIAGLQDKAAANNPKFNSLNAQKNNE